MGFLTINDLDPAGNEGHRGRRFLVSSKCENVSVMFVVMVMVIEFDVIVIPPNIGRDH